MNINDGNKSFNRKRNIMIACIVVLWLIICSIFIYSHVHWGYASQHTEQHIFDITLVLFLSFLFLSAAIIFLLSSRNQERLFQKQQRLIEILEATPDFVAMMDKKGRTVYINRAGRELMGFSETEDISNILISQYHPREDAEKLLRKGLPYLERHNTWKSEADFLSRDGQTIPMSQILISHKNKFGKITRFSTIARDIREQRRIENDLRIAAMVFDTSPEAILITNKENVIINVNAAFTYTTGYSKANVMGRTPNLLSSGKQGDEFYQVLWAALKLNGRWQGEIINKKKNGDLYTEWLSIVEIKDINNQAVRHIGIFSDISERKKAEALIKQQANHDALTGLPNRRLFDDRLTMAIKLAARDQKIFALMFLDLDHFKEINDKLGHDCGDRLLKQVSSRLQGCMRSSDTVARVGGDEFAILLQSISCKASIENAAKKLLSEIAAPFHVVGHDLNVTLSIGIAIYSENVKEIEDLVKAADKAMYYVKEHGRNNFKFAE